ncbi:MAG TPA: glycosyltransferase family 4 protein, partial [Geminicoccaceae bacterium]|nr:glycosyltransferase family 4 protein [Geminicoccaceae bacterium]
MHPSAPSLRRVAFLGNHPPRICGLASFTADLRVAVADAAPEVECFTLAMTDGAGPYEYPPAVRLEIPEANAGAYRRAAAFLHDSNTDVLSVQHEYGIFGGPDGDLLLSLLEQVRVPVVTTLHTVLERPTAGQRRVMDGIVRRSTRLVVMTRRSREILETVHDVPGDRVVVIPHGIPDTPFLDGTRYKGELGAEGRALLLTFGLLSPDKGIEHVIRALPSIVARRPDVLYVVLGATHPNLRRQQGEAYRASLVRLAERLGVDENVRFLDHFVDLPALTRAIAAADVYLTPYLNEAQSVSGTLAYSFGMGKPVVSTPYRHATELLAHGRGVLVPFADPRAIADAVLGLFDDPARTENIRKAAYELGRGFVWPRVGERYLEAFREARRETAARRPAGALRHGELPALKLDQLSRLLDSTGVAQHAAHQVVDRAHGYCLDDNARGLLLAVTLPRGHRAEQAPMEAELFARTAAFVQHAWNGELGRFRNFMGYDRRWLEGVGSEDSHGRAVWALGSVVRHANEASRRAWAHGLLEQSAEPVAGFTSPRAWSFALLGAVDYLAVRPEDLRFVRMRAVLTERLCDHLHANRRPGWVWFEDVLSYDNARLAQAVVASGSQAGRADWRAAGLEALDWLCGVQTGEGGHFRPIGSDGFWRHRGARATFDQQPLEAGASVGACLAAWRATRSLRWLAEARRAF